MNSNVILWKIVETSMEHFIKGLINLAVAGPRMFFKQHLIKNEEQTSDWKRYSACFGVVSTM